MTKSKLNGSVELLATAMRKVFTEAVQEGLEPVRKDMKDMESRLNTRIDTTNENVQAQLAQNRKDVRSDLREELDKR